jgi:C4-dicarboxylate transporter DctM subunit
MLIFLSLVILSLVFLALGAPVAYVLGGSAALVLAVKGDITLNLIAAQLLQGTNSFVLLAVPFFVLAGNLMNHGGITIRLIRFASHVIGWSPGGLAQVAVGANVIMSGMSGSEVADVTATGSILIPALKKKGYPAGYAASMIAGAGSIGPLIPPSIPFVIYGMLADTSVVKLFIAGIGAGLLVALFLMIMNYVIARREGYPTEPWVSFRALGIAFLDAMPGLIMPVIVVGGILGGLYTATEGAAIAVVYGLAIGLFVYHELRWHDFLPILIDSMKSSAAILFIIANASLFGVVLSLYHVGASLTSFFESISSSSFVLLIILNLAFLVVGVLIDATSAMILLVPLLVSSLDAYGIDRVHFGVIMALNLGVGLMLPPHGLAMLIVLRFAEIDIREYMHEAWPVVITMVLALVAVTYVPAVSLWLPNVLGVR